MKRIVLLPAVAAVAVAIGGAANAADIRRPPPPAVKAPAYVAPLFTWTGLYLGGNLGYGWSNGSGTITSDGTLAGLPAGSGPISGSGNGVLGGIQIGYNWQAGAIVYGLETDFQLSGGDGTITANTGGGPFASRGENEWFGTIRGRLGYAMDRWLFYVTGGGAYVHNKLTGPGFSSSETGWTWTVGGGVEAALWQNWSVKAEYLYLGTPSSVPIPPGTSVNGSVDSHIIRVGVNYHF